MINEENILVRCCRTGYHHCISGQQQKFSDLNKKRLLLYMNVVIPYQTFSKFDKIIADFVDFYNSSLGDCTLLKSICCLFRKTPAAVY